MPEFEASDRQVVERGDCHLTPREMKRVRDIPPKLEERHDNGATLDQRPESDRGPLKPQRRRVILDNLVHGLDKGAASPMSPNEVRAATESNSFRKYEDSA